jgi:hypothetical protein
MPGLAGLALLLAGCEKDTSGPTRVSGQVVEANSRQAVARPPQVQVWGLTRGSGGSYTPVGDPQPTDGQGNFSFSFPADAGRSYVLRATGGLGYYTDWGLAPTLQGGQKNAGVQVPVYAPAWVRVDLVDEPPRSRVWIDLWGWEGGSMQLALPRDTVFVFPYFAGTNRLLMSELTNEQGVRTRVSRTLTLAPLDTQRVRIAF